MKKPIDGYQKSVQNLREHIIETDRRRRDWAKEKWRGVDSQLFFIGKIALPPLATIGIILMAIVCLIRFIYIPDISRMLTGTEMGFGGEPIDDPTIFPFFVFVFLLINVLIFGVIKLFLGKRRTASYLISGSSFLLMVCAIIRNAADTALNFPTRRDAIITSYYELCTVVAAIMGIIFIVAAVCVYLIRKEDKEIDLMVEATMIKILPKDKKDLLSEEEYIKLIDEYIEKEKERS